MIKLDVLKRMDKSECFFGRGGKTALAVKLIVEYLTNNKGSAYPPKELYNTLIMDKVNVGKSPSIIPSGFGKILRRVWAYEKDIHCRGNYYFYDTSYIEDNQMKQDFIDTKKKK